ncbi:MAG: MFS transporter [Actinomycetota bacterium]|nr:MFS transporter [Actinomycetota bacterium]MDQ2957844.1 MFS transporter [Actinomycetota bacterium]
MSFYLMLPVVPEYALVGSASSAGAGLSTGALMITTVAVQPFTPRLLASFGHRKTVLLSCAVLGSAPLLMLPSATFAVVIASALVRGIGFGVFVVAMVSVIADLVPRERRGLGTGLYGAVAGAAGVLGAPAGLWLAHSVSYPAAFLAAALAALLFGAAAPPIQQPATLAGGRAEPAAVGARALAGPFSVELASTIAYGVVFTFLPIVTKSSAEWVAPSALFLQQLATMTSRYVAGQVADRHSSSQLLLPAVGLSALGLVVASWLANPALVLVGMIAFGLGFGAIQTASLMMMLDRVEANANLASVAWNVAFDAGTGLGAVLGGVALQLSSPTTMILATALIVLTSAPLARRRRVLASCHVSA